MALYAHSCGLKATVFIGQGKIAFGKLSQSMDYGAQTIQIAGDFDDCMRQVQDVCRQLKIYLVNSLNPFRLEDKKPLCCALSSSSVADSGLDCCPRR
jgi:threonine synthase